MDVSIQIERLEAINSGIQECIQSDELDHIQALIDERKSRIAKLIELQGNGKANVFPRYFDRLTAIKEGGDNLRRLMELKLKVLRTEMRKTGDAKTIAKGYKKGPQLVAAEFRRSTDITG